MDYWFYIVINTSSSRTALMLTQEQDHPAVFRALHQTLYNTVITG
jgi:hypothetical protein